MVSDVQRLLALKTLSSNDSLVSNTDDVIVSRPFLNL
jgi:hypothetical protein